MLPTCEDSTNLVTRIEVKSHIQASECLKRLSNVRCDCKLQLRQILIEIRQILNEKTTKSKQNTLHVNKI